VSEYGLIALLTALVAALSFTEPRFLRQSNILLILEQSSSLTIVAVPFAMLLMARHIDLSVGSALALYGVIASKLMADQAWSPIVAAPAVLVLGAGVGLVLGVLATRLSFHSFVMTLGALTAFRGLAFLLQGPRYSAGLPHSFRYLGQGRFRFLDIPVPVAIAGGVFLVAIAYYYRTRHGSHARAVGANPAAAFVSGIDVDRMIVTLYVMVGMAVALAALIQTSKLNAGPASVGRGFELQVLTAVLLGGVAFEGGRGSLHGVVLGAVFINVFNNGLQQWGVSSNAAQMWNGMILAAAAGFPALTALWLNRRRPGSGLRLEEAR
jgi:ribose transport system permease protein